MPGAGEGLTQPSDSGDSNRGPEREDLARIPQAPVVRAIPPICWPGALPACSHPDLSCPCTHQRQRRWLRRGKALRQSRPHSCPGSWTCRHGGRANLSKHRCALVRPPTSPLGVPCEPPSFSLTRVSGSVFMGLPSPNLTPSPTSQDFPFLPTAASSPTRTNVTTCGLAGAHGHHRPTKKALGVLACRCLHPGLRHTLDLVQLVWLWGPRGHMQRDGCEHRVSGQMSRTGVVRPGAGPFTLHK